jgi:hypothetical protein
MHRVAVVLFSGCDVRVQETEKKWLGARAKPLVIQALDTSRRVYVVVGLPCTESKDTVEKTCVAFDPHANAECGLRVLLL